MKKNYFLKGVAAVALGVAAVGCSHDAYVPTPQDVIKDYEAMFVKTFGQPSENQDWGFGAGTRAVDTWTDGHSCNWADKLNVVLPEGATEMTAPGWLSPGVYVIPTNANGSVSLGWAGFNEGDKIYVLGNVTELKEANYNGVVTFYNTGTLTYSVSSGSRHTIINTGILTINSYGNVGEVYNSGTLNLVKTYNPYYQDLNAKADIPNDMSVFSTGEGSVLMPDGGDFKAAADIHGTLVADADTKIQNSETQYICGVKVDGVLDMTEGHLQAATIEADEITFDGTKIWLTPGGHIKTDVIRMPNSDTAIYGESTSTGLIEVKDIYFENTNNFDDSFSANIYFKITGAIDFSNSTKFGGGAKHYANVEAYNADNTVLKGYNEGDGATGTPACGLPWSVGTPQDENKDKEEEEDWKFECRIFAEDLEATNASDFDFNDVVFDVYQKTNATKIVLQAAGGTLPLYIVDGEDVPYEVHAMFGEDTKTMINTRADTKELAPVEFEIAKTTYDKIGLYVQKTALLELKAEKGEPAAKFAVFDQDVDWQDEYKNINLKYPKFNDWVEKDDVKYFYK